MGEVTGIAWTDHTFNPWIGCTRVSEGCRNCYAEQLVTTRMGRKWGPGTERRRTSAANWKEPIRWAKKARAVGRRDKVFCASLADIFDFEAPIETRRDLWKLIGDTCDALDLQLLTKRPMRITPVMCEDGLNLGFFELTHCWLGTTTENHQTAEERIPEILQVDAAVRFLSCEPLIGPINLDNLKYRPGMDGWLSAFNENAWPELGKIDWVICGGESGAQARIMKPEWARNLRDQCASAGVAFFMKQMGSVFGPSKGHDLPDDLNIKQFPVSA